MPTPLNILTPIRVVDSFLSYLKSKKKQKVSNQVQNVKVGYLEHEVLAVEVLIIFSRSSAYGAKLHIPNFTCGRNKW